MNAFLKSLGGGFAGLLRFGGRDSRLRFWPYAAFIFFLSQLAGMALVLRALAPAMVETLERAGRTGPGLHPAGTVGGAPDLAPVVADMMGLSLLLTAATVLLLAAAAVRRLHDRGLAGWWGLLPLPFLAAGLVLVPKAIAGLSRADRPDPGWLAGLMANNLAYLGALGWLIYLLASPGTPGPNRFGPPPG